MRPAVCGDIFLSDKTFYKQCCKRLCQDLS